MLLNLWELENLWEDGKSLLPKLLVVIVSSVSRGAIVSDVGGY
jgi:hypothetical protein